MAIALVGRFPLRPDVGLLAVETFRAEAFKVCGVAEQFESSIKAAKMAEGCFVVVDALSAYIRMIEAAERAWLWMAQEIGWFPDVMQYSFNGKAKLLGQHKQIAFFLQREAEKKIAALRAMNRELQFVDATRVTRMSADPIEALNIYPELRDYGILQTFRETEPEASPRVIPLTTVTDQMQEVADFFRAPLGEPHEPNLNNDVFPTAMPAEEIAARFGVVVPGHQMHVAFDAGAAPVDLTEEQRAHRRRLIDEVLATAQPINVTAVTTQHEADGAIAAAWTVERTRETIEAQRAHDDVIMQGFFEAGVHRIDRLDEPTAQDMTTQQMAAVLGRFLRSCDGVSVLQRAQLRDRLVEHLVARYDYIEQQLLGRLVDDQEARRPGPDAEVTQHDLIDAAIAEGEIRLRSSFADLDSEEEVAGFITNFLLEHADGRLEARFVPRVRRAMEGLAERLFNDHEGGNDDTARDLQAELDQAERRLDPNQRLLVPERLAEQLIEGLWVPRPFENMELNLRVNPTPIIERRPIDGMMAEEDARAFAGLRDNPRLEQQQYFPNEMALTPPFRPGFILPAGYMFVLNMEDGLIARDPLGRMRVTARQIRTTPTRQSITQHDLDPFEVQVPGVTPVTETLRPEPEPALVLEPAVVPPMAHEMVLWDNTSRCIDCNRAMTMGHRFPPDVRVCQRCFNDRVARRAGFEQGQADRERRSAEARAEVERRMTLTYQDVQHWTMRTQLDPGADGHHELDSLIIQHLREPAPCYHCRAICNEALGINIPVDPVPTGSEAAVWLCLTCAGQLQTAMAAAPRLRARQWNITDREGFGQAVMNAAAMTPDETMGAVTAAYRNFAAANPAMEEYYRTAREAVF